jgi:hypothetical protein
VNLGQLLNDPQTAKNKKTKHARLTPGVSY